MGRHTKLLNEFSRSKSQAELLNKLQKSRKAVEANANGTSGYRICLLYTSDAADE